MKEKEKIIIHSTNEFLENGFYKTTMDQLASGMKISKKTIYKFFPSKILLLEKVIETFENKIKNDLEKIVESNECLIVKLKNLGAYFAKFSLKVNGKFISDFFNHQPELWKKIDTFRTDVIENVWSKIISEGKKEGLIIDVSNSIILIVVQSAIRGIINPRFLNESSLSTNEAFEQMFTILMNGILTEKGKIEFKKQEWKQK